MAKRIFQGVVIFFAIYAFVFVPLGKKTALEHVRAIVETPAAQDAAAEVKGGVTRLVRRLQSEARQSAEATDRDLAELPVVEDVEEPEEQSTDRRSVPQALSPAVPPEARSLPKPGLRALSAERVKEPRDSAE